MTHSASPCSPLKLSGMSPEQAPGHHLQPLLFLSPLWLPTAKVGLAGGGTEEAPAGAISPNRKGEEPGVHVRYKQLLAKGGRERAQGLPAGGQILTLRPAGKEAGCQPSHCFVATGPSAYSSDWERRPHYTWHIHCQPLTHPSPLLECYTCSANSFKKIKKKKKSPFQLSLSSIGCCDAAEQHEASLTNPPPEQPIPIAMLSAAGR